MTTHKWGHFRRVRRGVYEIASPYRRDARPKATAHVAKSAAAYRSTTLRDSVHAVISRGQRAFVVECLEVAVVTQGRTLDKAVASLREALILPLKELDVGTLQAIVRQAVRITLIRSSESCSAIHAWGYRQSLQG